MVDTFHDADVLAKASELKAKWAELAAPHIRKLEKRAEEIRRSVANETTSVNTAKLQRGTGTDRSATPRLATPHRLNLIKALLATGDSSWLRALLKQRQMRVHIYRVSGQATEIADLNDPEQCQRMLDDLMEVMPTGESSQLGTDVSAILKTFRGGSLSAIVMFTDGVTTRGEDIPSAARAAARAGIPLHLIGVGDAADPPDLDSQRSAGRGGDSRQRSPGDRGPSFQAGARHARFGAGDAFRNPQRRAGGAGSPDGSTRPAGKTRQSALRASTEGSGRKDVHCRVSKIGPATRGCRTGKRPPRTTRIRRRGEAPARPARRWLSPVRLPLREGIVRTRIGCDPRQQVDRHRRLLAQRQPGPSQAGSHVDQSVSDRR